MNAEKGSFADGEDMFSHQGTDMSLLDQYSRYSQEAKALRDKLLVTTVRVETREGRLKEVENFLMPELQRKIEG